MKPKGKDHRVDVIERMSSSVLSAARVFVLHFQRPNNSALKQLRIILGSGSHLFLAQNTAMSQCLALLGARGE